MEKLENSYDCVLSLPLNFIISIGGIPNLSNDFNHGFVGLAAYIGNPFPIGYILTWYFRTYHPENSIIQFRINKVTLCDYKYKESSVDFTGYSTISQFHVFGLRFLPTIPYIPVTMDTSGYVIHSEQQRCFHFESDDNEDLTYEFKNKLISAYGSYISFKNDFNQICDIPGQIVVDGKLVLPTISTYYYRQIRVKIHISIRDN